MVYRWEGRIAGNAQACGEELDRLQHEHGGKLSPTIVVQAATAADNPLHRCFEWDDAKAAGKWRIEQARTVIRSIRVITEDSVTEQEPVRCFVSLDGEEDGKSYVSTARLSTDEELFKRALAQFKADMLAFQKRYRDFAVIRDLIERTRLEAEAMYAKTDQGGTVGAVSVGL